jgi:hypothetical protein
MPKFSKRISFRFLHQNSVCNSPLFHTCYMPHSSIILHFLTLIIADEGCRSWVLLTNYKSIHISHSRHVVALYYTQHCLNKSCALFESLLPYKSSNSDAKCQHYYYHHIISHVRHVVTEGRKLESTKFE